MPREAEKEGGNEGAIVNVVPIVRWLWRLTLPYMRRWRRPKRKEVKTMKRTLSLIALAAVLAAGCSATQPGGAGGMTPAQQCQVIQTVAMSAQTAVLLAAPKIKNADARMAVDAALTGVSGGANTYCEAVARGETPDGLTVFLTSFNTAMADLNRQLRAAQATG